MSGRKRANSAGGKAAKAAKSGKSGMKSSKQRKAKYSAKYSNKQLLSVNSLLGTLGPDRLRAKLKYCQTNQYVLYTAGAVTPAAYNLNSVYDPDSTGVGHQPRGLDQVYAMGYTRYLVTAVKFLIVHEQRQNENVLGGGFDYAAVITNNGYTAANHELTLETCAKWMRVYQYPMSSTTTQDPPMSNSTTSMSKFIRMKDIQGRPLDESDDAGTLTSSSGGTNPNASALLTVTGFNHTAGAITNRHYFSIFLTYYVEFFRATTAAAS